MSHHFRENKEVYQGFILSQVILETPCWKAYKLVCKIRKEDINYRDFEFIYMKFSAGHTELDVQVPEWTEEDVTLVNLPDPILRKVLNIVDVRTRFVSRKVCKRLQELVDTTQRCCDYVSISMCNPQYFKLEIDYCDIRYDIASKKVILRYDRDEITKHSLDDPFAVAMKDLGIVLKNLKMKTFSFYVANGYEEEYGTLLLSTLQQIRDNNQSGFKVKSLYTSCGNKTFIFPLLKMMKTPPLEKLEILVATDETINPEIFSTEQWRNLKRFESQNRVEPANLLRSFTHLERFEVFCALTTQQVLQLSRVLAASTTFRSCSIRLDYSPMMIFNLAKALNVQFESEETLTFSHRMRLRDPDDALLLTVKYAEHIDYFSIDFLRERSLR